MGYISKIEDLKFWFDEIDKPHWNLYRGHLTKMVPSQLIYKNDKPGMEVTSSFDLLQQIIEMNSGGGGKFTVFVPIANNRGYSTHIGLNLNGRSSSFSLGAIPAQMQGYVSMNDVDKRIEEARERWELQKRIEDLEAAQDANTPISEKVMEHVLQEGGIGEIVKMCGHVLNGLVARISMPPGKTQVSLSGFDQEHTGQPKNQVPPATQPSSPPEDGYIYDQNKILDFLNPIRGHFDDEQEFYGFLNNVAFMFCSNPDYFKKMVPKQPAAQQ